MFYPKISVVRDEIVDIGDYDIFSNYTILLSLLYRETTEDQLNILSCHILDLSRDSCIFVSVADNSGAPLFLVPI
jgi:hypothetical protein